MALQIVWTPEAKDHLDEILSYPIERNGTHRYAQKIFEKIKSILESTPKSKFNRQVIKYFLNLIT